MFLKGHLPWGTQVFFSQSLQQIGLGPPTHTMKVVCSESESQSHSVVSDSLQPHALYSLCMGVSRQEYWSEQSFPPPGDLPNPGIKPRSLALAGEFFTTEPWKPMCRYRYKYISM